MHRNYGFWTYFDFATFLVVCTAIAGAIWAIDAWVVSPGKRKNAKEETVDRNAWTVMVEYAKSFFPVLLAVLMLRSFLVEPFKIPTGSMIPTLLVGDFILVNKFAYGIRLPVSNTKIIDISKPKRGEVIVFRYPRDPRVNYIKRVIGLPGDVLEYRNKKLYINGKEQSQELQLDFHPTGVGRDVYSGKVDVFQEHLGDVTHIMQVYPNSHHPAMDSFSVQVPQGKYFAMGDNRDDSSDSRVWGFVPEENLVGKAFFIWFHLNFNAPSWSEKLKWSRIGGDIH